MLLTSTLSTLYSFYIHCLSPSLVPSFFTCVHHDFTEKQEKKGRRNYLRFGIWSPYTSDMSILLYSRVVNLIPCSRADGWSFDGCLMDQGSQNITCLWLMLKWILKRVNILDIFQFYILLSFLILGHICNRVWFFLFYFLFYFTCVFSNFSFCTNLLVWKINSYILAMVLKKMRYTRI